MSLWKRRQSTPQEQVTHAIDKLERSNRLILRACHTFAFFLIIATSVASLISLASEVLQVVIHGQGNVAQDASVVITLLLVMAMDTGMIYAATMIRIMRQRGEAVKAMALHIAIMVIVALLEAGTYCYMLYLYERPDNWISWALIIARGCAVPALSIYLSMAEEITVNTSDIARMTEIFTGVALLRDLVTQANEPDATLARKIAIYRAAATLSADQRAKLNAMYSAVIAPDDGLRIVDADPMPPAPAQREIEALPPPDESLRMPVMNSAAPASPAPKMQPRKRSTKAAKRKTTSSKRASVPPPDAREAAVYAYLDENPGTSARQLAAAMNLSVTAAQQDLRAWKAARKATRQPGPVYARSRKATPPEPETIPDAMVSMLEESAREWLAAHPTATAEDVMKEFGLSAEYADQLMQQSR